MCGQVCSWKERGQGDQRESDESEDPDDEGEEKRGHVEEPESPPLLFTAAGARHEGAARWSEVEEEEERDAGEVFFDLEEAGRQGELRVEVGSANHDPEQGIDQQTEAKGRDEAPGGEADVASLQRSTYCSPSPPLQGEQCVVGGATDQGDGADSVEHEEEVVHSGDLGGRGAAGARVCREAVSRSGRLIAENGYKQL